MKSKLFVSPSSCRLRESAWVFPPSKRMDHHGDHIGESSHIPSASSSAIMQNNNSPIMPKTRASKTQCAEGDAPGYTVPYSRFGLRLGMGTRRRSGGGVACPSFQRLPERPFRTVPGGILRKFLPGKVSNGTPFLRLIAL